MLCLGSRDLGVVAFIYGMLPPAPSCYVFARNYDVIPDQIAGTVVLCTLVFAPVMYLACSIINIGNCPDSQSTMVCNLVFLFFVLLIRAVFSTAHDGHGDEGMLVRQFGWLFLVFVPHLCDLAYNSREFLPLIAKGPLIMEYFEQRKLARPSPVHLILRSRRLIVYISIAQILLSATSFLCDEKEEEAKATIVFHLALFLGSRFCLSGWILVLALETLREAKAMEFGTMKPRFASLLLHWK